MCRAPGEVLGEAGEQFVAGAGDDPLGGAGGVGHELDVVHQAAPPGALLGLQDVRAGELGDHPEEFAGRRGGVGTDGAGFGRLGLPAQRLGRGVQAFRGALADAGDLSEPAAGRLGHPGDVGEAGGFEALDAQPVRGGLAQRGDRQLLQQGIDPLGDQLVQQFLRAGAQDRLAAGGLGQKPRALEHPDVGRGVEGFDGELAGLADVAAQGRGQRLAGGGGEVGGAVDKRDPLALPLLGRGEDGELVEKTRRCRGHGAQLGIDLLSGLARALGAGADEEAGQHTGGGVAGLGNQRVHPRGGLRDAADEGGQIGNPGGLGARVHAGGPGHVPGRDEEYPVLLLVEVGRVRHAAVGAVRQRGRGGGSPGAEIAQRRRPSEQFRQLGGGDLGGGHGKAV